jgi:hypothetical protein
MIFIFNFKQLGTNIMNNEKYSLYLNEIRKNLAAPGKLLLRCSTTYIPVGDLDRSPLFRGSLAIAMHRRTINQPCLPEFP